MENMLQEIARISIPISRFEEIFIKWHNSILSICVDKGIQLYDFEHNLQRFEKSINLKAIFLPCSKSSAFRDVISEEFEEKTKSNLHIIEMLQNPHMWPLNPILSEEMTSIADFQWSPVGVTHNAECLLATLTNVGNVEIFGRSRITWESIIDLSQIYKQRLKSSDSLIVPNNLEELKTVADMIESASICWGPKKDYFSSFFAMAQRNGTIIVWLLENESELQAKFLGKIETDIESVSMTWIQKSDKEFLLVCSSILGEVFAVNCCLDNDKVQLVNVKSLWSYKDKMAAKCLNFLIVNDMVVLVYPKHRHLVAQMIDKDCNVIAEYVHNVNDYRITDISLHNNELYLTTINRKFCKLKLQIQNNVLTVDLIPKEIKDLHPKFELYGVGFSMNSVILALAVINTNVAHRKTKRNVDIIFVTDPEICEVDMLLKNPAKTLTHHWDCIELLRYRTMKARTMPTLDYNEIFESSDTDLYKLRVYLLFTILYNNLEKVTRNGEKVFIPETSIEFVKEKILAMHTSEVISELFEIYKRTKEMLDGIHLETYYGAKNYLEYFCEKYKRNLTEFATAKALNLSERTPSDICQCCDEKINGFTCKNGHLNMFCSLTFSPIESDEYLACKSCNSTARIELYVNSPKCIFCNLYLHKVVL